MSRQVRRTQATAGFTLIEVIISIAVLAIASVFILQMFLTAATLNGRARDLDQAYALSSSLIERFSLLDSPQKLTQEAEFAYATPQQTDGGYELESFFDDAWQPVSSREAAAYALRCMVQPAGATQPVPAVLGSEGGAEVTQELYTIEITTHFLPSLSEEKLLSTQRDASLFLTEEGMG